MSSDRFRRPVAAYVRTFTGAYEIQTTHEVVVCDDGAVFWRDAAMGGAWTAETEAIPGTEAGTPPPWEEKLR